MGWQRATASFGCKKERERDSTNNPPDLFLRKPPAGDSAETSHAVRGQPKRPQSRGWRAEYPRLEAFVLATKKEGISGCALYCYMLQGATYLMPLFLRSASECEDSARSGMDRKRCIEMEGHLVPYSQSAKMG